MSRNGWFFILQNYGSCGIRGPIPLLRINAHLLSVITKVASQMDYQGSKPQSDMMHQMRIMTGSLQHMIE
jgi:hypothetical protein